MKKQVKEIIKISIMGLALISVFDFIMIYGIMH